MILADECLSGFIVSDLRNTGFKVEWIVETNYGIPDIEVIEHAKRNKQILITEDKDFGEWVFAHKITGLTIIFLRYDKKDYQQIITYLKQFIPVLLQEPNHLFITISKNKIRKRTI